MRLAPASKSRPHRPTHDGPLPAASVSVSRPVERARDAEELASKNCLAVYRIHPNVDEQRHLALGGDVNRFEDATLRGTCVDIPRGLGSRSVQHSWRSTVRSWTALRAQGVDACYDGGVAIPPGPDPPGLEECLAAAYRSVATMGCEAGYGREQHRSPDARPTSRQRNGSQRAGHLVGELTGHSVSRPADDQRDGLARRCRARPGRNTPPSPPRPPRLRGSQRRRRVPAPRRAGARRAALLLPVVTG